MKLVKKVMVLAAFFIIIAALSLVGCQAAAPATTAAAATTAAPATTAAAAETTAAAATTEAWIPYYKTADFKPFVESYEKEVVSRPDDERTIAPVDRISPETLKIGYIGCATNPFCDAIKTGFDAGAMELAAHNVVCEYVLPGASLSTADYGEAVEVLVNKGFNAIVAFTLSDAQIPFAEKAIDAGVPYASVCCDAVEPGRSLFFIGQDLYNAGVACADKMAEILGGKGEVAIITGFYSVVSHELRRKGFEDTIAAKYPDIKIVGSAENHDAAGEGFDRATEFLNANPNLSAIYNTAGGPTGAIEAIMQAGKADTVKVGCYYVPELADYFKAEDKVLQFAVAQDAFAESHDGLIRMFNFMMEGTKPLAYNLYTEAFVVTPENLQEFLDSGQGA